MGRKGKRRRRDRRGAAGHERRVPAEAPVTPEAPGEPVVPDAGGAAPSKVEEGDGRARAAGGLFRRPGQAPAAQAYPPLGPSLAEGAIAVGRSPAILAAAFLAVLFLWGLYSAIGAEPLPTDMVMLFALPPLSLFPDVTLVLRSVEGAAASLALVAAVLLIRSFLFAAIGILIADAVAGRPSGREVLRDAVRVAGPMFALLAGELLLVVVSIFLQGFFGPVFGLLASWIAGLYFLAMAPAILAVERSPAKAADSLVSAVRRSFRAGRLPGFRHLLLVVAYVFFVVFLLILSSGPATGVVPSVTPTVVAWVVALAATFAHLVVLGALTWRWTSVADQVPAETTRRRS